MTHGSTEIGEKLTRILLRITYSYFLAVSLLDLYALLLGGKTPSSLDILDILNAPLTIAMTFVCFFLSSILLPRYWNRKKNGSHPAADEKKILFFSALCYALLSLILAPDIATALGMSLLLLLLMVHCIPRAVLEELAIAPSRSHFLIFAVALCGSALALFISYYNGLTYFVPTLDMGLFEQMFFYMRRGFTMMTTLERNVLLNHFAVHFSPVFYLLLPFYIIFPFVMTLRVCTIVLFLLSLFPLLRICRHRQLSPTETTLVAILYLLYPALNGAGYFSIYENSFLPLALLLFLMFMEEDKFKGMIVSALFICSIKEDAPLYLIVISCYMLTLPEKKKKGTFFLVFSSLCFLAETAFLKVFGTGLHDVLFSNLTRDGGSLSDVIGTIITVPSYFISQVFSLDNLEFLLEMFVPLLFLPFFTKKWSRYLLMLPLIFFNLMSDYLPLHNIFFHYTYGSAPLLIYLMLINLCDLPQKKQRSLLWGALIPSCFLYISLLLPRTQNAYLYLKDENERKLAAVIELALEQIPPDASVVASEYLCLPLADREEIYYMGYLTDYAWKSAGKFADYIASSKITDAEYVVFDLRWDGDTYQYGDKIPFSEYGLYSVAAERLDLVQRYDVASYIPNVIVIYRLKTAASSDAP